MDEPKVRRRMPKGRETESVAFRLSKDTIEEIDRYWKNHGMLNRSEFLETACKLLLEFKTSVSSDDPRPLALAMCDKFITSGCEASVQTRGEFFEEAAKIICHSEKCPNCGCWNLSYSNTCYLCGSELHPVDPNLEYIGEILEEFKQTHPLPDGETYVLLDKDDELGQDYAILRMSTRDEIFSIARYITKEDIENVKKKHTANNISPARSDNK